MNSEIATEAELIAPDHRHAGAVNESASLLYSHCSSRIPATFKANDNRLITCGGIVLALYRYAVFFVLLLVPALQFAETEVSRADHIDGMEVPALHAHKILPPRTPVITRAAIYVEKTSRGMYYHSNFISLAPDGTFADNPTIILTTDNTDLLEIFENIVYWGKTITPARANAALTALNENVKIFVDGTVFDEEGFPRINVREIEHVNVVESKNLFTTSVSAELLSRESLPSLIMAPIVGCCLYGIPADQAPSYWKALTLKPFSPEDVRLLLLVRDSATQRLVQQTSTLARAYIGDVKSPPVDLSQIRSAFASAQGKVVILVSDVDGENFVVSHANGSGTSSISIKAVRDLAAKYQIQLIDLGCGTARNRGLKGPGSGVTTAFTTVDAMNALARVIPESADYADFFQGLASGRYKIVIDRGFTLGWPLCADVYAQAHNSTAWIKLARVFVSFRIRSEG
jgi:hypothetical protein